MSLFPFIILLRDLPVNMVLGDSRGDTKDSLTRCLWGFSRTSGYRRDPFDHQLRFEFQKSGQLFIRTHNETLSVVAVCVCNPDRSPTKIHIKNVEG
jgi:hypothetical protein